MVLVDPDDLASHTARNLPQLAFLVSRGLVQGGHSQIDSCTAHRFSLGLFFARRIAGLKSPVLLAFWRASTMEACGSRRPACGTSRGTERTPCCDALGMPPGASR